jgi:DNA polymerase (family X)
MTNKQIARVLRETASLIELTGGNTFRARAYENAARTIDRLEESAAAMLDAGELTEVKGIGSGLAAQIRDLLDRGSFAMRDELRRQVPSGVIDLLRVKGIGARKVRQLWQDLGVASLDDLEQAAAAGRLAGLAGFGEKTQDKILANLELLRAYGTRRHYADVLTQTPALLETLRSIPGVLRAEVSGALRRKMETVEGAEFIVATTHTADVSSRIAEALGLHADAPDDGTTGDLAGQWADGLPVRVAVVEPGEFGTAWWERTGSPDHCGAFVRARGAPSSEPDEARIYATAGLHYIEPELRENLGELEAAETGLPRLLEASDLKGSLHNHTTYSDGGNTLREMADAARLMGLTYLGICDHSRSLVIANGLPVERLYAQLDEIRRLNTEFEAGKGPRFRVFSGTESDILPDGSLDYPDDVLASLDVVVASVHSGFNMTIEEATHRVIRAVESPHTTILGHPTGRLLLGREGYPLDHEQVIRACAANGVAIEVNANPYRLDLDWRWIRLATGLGVPIAINPDAHSTEELRNVFWGVEVARKGWLTADQCLNAMPLDAFEHWLSTRRSGR